MNGLEVVELPLYVSLPLVVDFSLLKDGKSLVRPREGTLGVIVHRFRKVSFNSSRVSCLRDTLIASYWST